MDAAFFRGQKSESARLLLKNTVPSILARFSKAVIDFSAGLLQQVKTEALFIDANKGRPMQKQSLYIRIKRLVKIARVKKKVGAHTLRHSIATHLLQSGMTLERIKDFLGHSHLDSTQIYTHLANEPL